MDNLDRIFHIAIALLGETLNQPGHVSPRVIAVVLERGRFCEDSLSARYWGGILAASRSTGVRDDRGITVLALLMRLSTYEIHSHYVCYHMVKRVFDGTSLKLSRPADRSEARIYIPLEAYIASLGPDEPEQRDLGAIVRHVASGLDRELLIENCEAYGFPESWDPSWRPREPAGLEVQPSPLGVELFLWAHGLANRPIDAFLDPTLQFAPFPEITIPSDAERPPI